MLDPLDGTKNFVSGLPLFAVMAAAVRRGRIVCGLIHDPVTRTSALAEDGAGAWLRPTKERAARARPASVTLSRTSSPAIIALGLPRPPRREPAGQRTDAGNAGSAQPLTSSRAGPPPRTRNLMVHRATR